jgi:AraC family transcriptional regulator
VTGGALTLALSERLGDAVDYLEARLGGPVDVGQAARRAGFSRWHFMRLFQAAAGLPVAEYVRRRRLSRAAEALTAGRPVLETALDWGYESQAAFTRAFAQMFGVTPAAFARGARAADGAFELVLRFEPRKPFPFGPPPAPGFEERPAFRAVGLGTRAPTRRYQSFVDIPAFWDDWLRNERWRAVPGVVPGRPHYGLIRGHANGEIEYVIALEVAPGTPAPRGYRAIEVAGGRYATFAGQGAPTRVIQSLALGVFGLWLPASGERLRRDGWELEIYWQDPKLPPGELRCEVAIPLARRVTGAAAPSPPAPRAGPGAARRSPRGGAGRAPRAG